MMQKTDKGACPKAAGVSASPSESAVSVLFPLLQNHDTKVKLKGPGPGFNETHF